MKRSAFTLIELLVVIAIIAILAAILFPVFAQAKQAAKRTAALSNTKNISTALHIYASDADDFAPSIYDGSGDMDVWLRPYTKNLDIFYSPERTESHPDCGNVRCRGFGYNWGFEIRGAGGMIQQERCSDGGSPVGCGGRGGRRVNPGFSMTAFEEPARLFAFGDTYDTPRMTLGAVDDWITYTLPNGFNDNAQLRYGGKFNMGFADGHAKIVRYKGGVADSPVGRVAVPRDYNERLYGYCAQLDGMIIPFIRSGNTTAIPCRQVVALPEAYNVVWWKN